MNTRSLLTQCITTLALALTASTFTYAGELSSIKAAGEIRVATSLSVPPYTFTNGDMQPDGSDVATAKLLAKDLGVKLKIVSVPVASRIPMLQTDKADLVISVLSMTPERAEVIDFSRPYSLIREVVMAPKDVTVKSYDDLKGKAIGVARGTVEDQLITEKAKGAQIRRFEDVSTLLAAAASGQIQYVATGLMSLAELNQKTHDRFESKLVLKDFMLAIGLQKNHPELHQWVNQWVADKLKNGELGKIFEHYHHVSLPSQVMDWAPDAS